MVRKRRRYADGDLAGAWYAIACTDDPDVNAAVAAAKAVHYVGAGTVEFMLAADGQFYFLEMNTRLQVEHPVTELITGLDLVALQIKVAQGEPLGLTQEDVTLSGHAIEVRLYAEDVAGGFLPSTGTVDLWLPPSGDGVRVDAGIATGLEVSPFYDPMIAKIMAHGPTRDVARQRLIEALRRTGLFGPKTNRDFLIDALGRPAFAQGEATTAFIDETYTADDLADAAPLPEITAAAAAIFYMLESNEAQARAFAVDDELMNWSSTGRLASVYRFGTPEEPEDVTVIAAGPDAYHVAIGDASHEVALLDADPARCRLKIDGVTHDVIFDAPETGVLHISMADRTCLMRNLYAFAGAEDDSAGGGRILAPMHGLILEVHVREGQAVTKGETLAVLEAMKMQHQIRAEADGTVRSIRCTAGAQVPAGDVLVEIDVSTEEQ